MAVCQYSPTPGVEYCDNRAALSQYREALSQYSPTPEGGEDCADRVVVRQYFGTPGESEKPTKYVSTNILTENVFLESTMQKVESRANRTNQIKIKVRKRVKT